MTIFSYFYHKCSIQYTNLRIDVNSLNVVEFSGQGLSLQAFYAISDVLQK